MCLYEREGFTAMPLWPVADAQQDRRPPVDLQEHNFQVIGHIHGDKLDCKALAKANGNAPSFGCPISAVPACVPIYCSIVGWVARVEECLGTGNDVRIMWDYEFVSNPRCWS